MSLKVKWSKLKLFGNKAFSVCAPKLFIQLPQTLRECDDLQDFKGLLTIPKTRLKSYGDCCFPAAAPLELNKLPLMLDCLPHWTV